MRQEGTTKWQDINGANVVGLGIVSSSEKIQKYRVNWPKLLRQFFQPSKGSDDLPLQIYQSVNQGLINLFRCRCGATWIEKAQKQPQPQQKPGLG